MAASARRRWEEGEGKRCPGEGEQKILMHPDEENTPSTSPGDSLGTLGSSGRQIGVAKPVSGRQVSSTPGSGRVVTSAPRQTLIEQKLIEINIPEDISTWCYELINSPMQSEILPLF